MLTIEIDFDVFKALTAKRATEETTYNDVIRKMLDLEPSEYNIKKDIQSGCTYKGIFFPDGTRFQANYKGKIYASEIINGAWVMSDGTVCSSPSSAAKYVTGNNVNGWRFWQALRPGNNDWKLLDLISS